MYTINLPKCAEADVLCRTLAGHRGFYYSQEKPEWEPGDHLRFTIYGDDVRDYGEVKKVEFVGDQGVEWYGWWVTFWMDIDNGN